MKDITSLFRHCPGCGRRFEVRLESRVLVREDRVTSNLPAMESDGEMGSMPLVVGDGEPITIDTKEFQYTYKCRHCGHEWSEKRDKQEKE